MYTLITELALQGTFAADTVLMRAVPPESTFLQTVLSIAEVLAVLLAYALLGAAVIAVLKLRKAVDLAKSSFDEVARDVRALADNLNKISQSAVGIADIVRKEVDSVQDTVAYANERTKRAITGIADSVDGFNRSVGLVQQDAQNAIVTAISTIRGVRAGVSALGIGRSKKKRRRAAAAAIEADLEHEPDNVPARPRLKRRARVEG
jgi:uncharacterized protein YoxC